MSQDRVRGRVPAIILAGALSLGLVGIVGAPASAATIPVTTWAELVAAIDAANLDPDVDTITLTGVDADYVANTPLPQISTPVHLEGPGSHLLTIDLNGSDGVRIDGVDEASVRGLRLIDGDQYGIFVTGSTVVEITDVAVEGATGFGLGIQYTSANVQHSTFVTNAGGGAWATIEANEVVAFSDTTFEGNSSGVVLHVWNSARATLTDVTVNDSDNRGVSAHGYDQAEVTFANVESSNSGGGGIMI